MSSKSANTQSKSRMGSGGPRTADGKSKSSQNSAKHNIFVPRVLPEEENVASLLDDEIRAEFGLKGAMELRTGRDLVQNELEAARIDKYAVQEFKKAQMLARVDVEHYDLRHTPFLRFPIPKEKEAQEGYCTRLRPLFCASFLNSLKERVKERGPRPDEDLDFLSLIYGNQMTAFGEAIVFQYTIFRASERLNKGDEKTAERKNGDDKTPILEALDVEIRSQESRMVQEEVWEIIEGQSDWVVLPPDETLDRIERYRTARARKRSRLLGDLETIRRLKET